MRLFKGGHDAKDKKKSRANSIRRSADTGIPPSVSEHAGGSYVDDAMDVPFASSAAPDASEC